MPDRDDQPLLVQYLAGRDLPCPRCGYNLRGATSAACPECGDALRLQVGLVEPRMAAYMTTLVVTSVGLGGSALFGMIAATQAPRGWWGDLCGRLLVVQLLMTGVLLPLLVFRRRRIRRAGRAFQWLLCWVTCAIVLGLSVAIIATFDD